MWVRIPPGIQEVEMYITGGVDKFNQHWRWAVWKNVSVARTDARWCKLPVIYKIKEWRKI